MVMPGTPEDDVFEAEKEANKSPNIVKIRTTTTSLSEVRISSIQCSKKCTKQSNKISSSSSDGKQQVANGDAKVMFCRAKVFSSYYNL